MENRPTDDEVWIIYQDCPMCGAREKWGEAQTSEAEKSGKKIVKIPFTDYRAKGHMLKAIQATKKLAVEKQIVTFPFFWDGKNYAKNISDLTVAPKKKTVRRKKGQDAKSNSSSD